MMQLATVSDNQPWVCTVYFVHDGNHNLYWASLPNRQHSQHIRVHPRVAAAIAIEYTIGKKVIGIQIEGDAIALQPPDYDHRIVKRYAKRFLRDKEWIKNFMAGNTQHRLYKLTPSAIFLFDEAHLPAGERHRVL